jgi:hypothetical protein
VHGKVFKAQTLRGREQDEVAMVVGLLGAAAPVSVAFQRVSMVAYASTRRK